jgi:hypothetical protein
MPKSNQSISDSPTNSAKLYFSPFNRGPSLMFNMYYLLEDNKFPIQSCEILYPGISPYNYYTSLS